jgi:hypothetical protein
MRDTHRGRRRRPLLVEPLDARTLLSGLATTTLPPVGPPSAQTIPLPIIVALNGTTRGAYSFVTKNPDIGKSYTVATVGKFKTYGEGTVVGTLHTLGNVASGHATGTLTVYLPGGTVTLSLTGPLQKGFSPLPTEFSFVITKGTGKFHNAVGDPVGAGTVTLSLKPIPGSTATAGAGQLTMVFHSKPVAIA